MKDKQPSQYWGYVTGPFVEIRLCVGAWRENMYDALGYPWVRQVFGPIDQSEVRAYGKRYENYRATGGDPG